MGYLKHQVQVYKYLDTDVWDSTGITISDISDISWTEGIGQIKDTARVTLVNPQNRLFRHYFSGDGSTKTFQMTYYPIPTSIQSDKDRFKVVVGGVQKTYSTDFTVASATGLLTFVSAPASGSRNIEVDWNVIEPNDQLKIKRWRNSSTAPSVWDFDGVVTDMPSTFEDNRYVTANIKNWIEILFDTVCLVDAQNADLTYRTPVEVLQEVLNFLKNWHLNRKIYWHPANPSAPASGGSWSTDSAQVHNYRKAIEIIELVSSKDYNKSADYIYWIVVG